MRHTSIHLLLIVFLFILGCPEDDDDTGDDDTGDDDAGDDDTGDDDTVPDDALVLEIMRGDPVSGEPVDPAVGVAVAATLPGQDPLEGTTGDDGRVVFSEIDVTAVADLSLSLVLPNYEFSGGVGLDAAFLAERMDGDGVVGWTMLPLGQMPPTTVSVGGTATNMADVGHNLTVTGTAPGIRHQLPGPDWSVRVPTGEAFTLVALEWYLPETGTVSNRGVEQDFVGWTTLDHDAVSADTTAELDMTPTLTAVDVAGTLSLPEHGDSDFFEVGRMYHNVRSVGFQGAVFLGAAQRIDATKDPLVFEHDSQHVLPAVADEVYTHYTLVALTGDRYAGVALDGPPVAGAVALAMPEPPVVSGAPASITDELAWSVNAADAADDALHGEIAIWTNPIASLWSYVGTLDMPRGSTGATLPPLPSSVDPIDVWGENKLQVQVRLVEDGEFGGTRIELRHASSDAVEIPL